jgi:hypothetical protein
MCIYHLETKLMPVYFRTVKIYKISKYQDICIQFTALANVFLLVMLEVRLTFSGPATRAQCSARHCRVGNTLCTRWSVASSYLK